MTFTIKVEYNQNLNRRLVFIMSLLLLCLYCNSQELNSFLENKIIKSFSTEDGLIHPDVTSITQDEDGFIWIGTEIGMQRYDGYRFQNFINDIGIRSNLQNSIIKDLVVDRKGKIWAATWGAGISIFDTEDYGFYDFEKNLIENHESYHKSIQCLSHNRDDSFWIGTHKGLVYYSAKDSLINVYRSEPGNNKSISDNWIMQIIDYGNDNFYFVGADGALNYYRSDSDDFKRINIVKTGSTRTIPIYCAYKYTKQYLFLGTSQGTYLYDIQSGNYYPLVAKTNGNNLLEKNQITGMYYKDDNEIWVATLGHGLFQISVNKDKEQRVFIEEVKNVVPEILVNDVFTDEQGNVWIATFNNGIKLIINKELCVSTIDLETDPVYCVAKGNNNNLWIGTIGGGLYSYNMKTHAFNQYTVSSGLSSNYIRYIYVDGTERLMIGTLNGLNVLDLSSESISVFSDEKGILNSEIVFISKDQNDNFWLGSVSNGLVYLDVEKNKVQAFTPDPVPTNVARGNTNVRSALFDNQGRLWVGIYGGGLNLFDVEHEKFTKRYLHEPTDSNSIKDNFVLDLSIDDKNRIWIGTLGGFHQFDPDSETFINYPISGDITTSSVQAIIDDNNDHVWISTFNGLIVFNKSTESYIDLDQSDGLLNRVFVNGSKCRDKSGNLFFGSWDKKRKVVIINPENLSVNNDEPELKLVDFRLYNREVEIGKKGSPLNKHISKTKSISLKHNQTAITIDYVAINYIASENNKYAFKMEGLEEDWRYVGDQRVANYSNIAPGNYTFMVKASNNDEIWTSDPLELDIKVLPHPLKSDLAISIYLFLFILLNFFVIRFIKRFTENKHQIQVVEIERNKEKQLTQFKLQFFTNISHELRTHLTLIVSPINKLLQKGKRSVEDQNLLGQINLNVKRLVKLTDEIIDFRKVEQGKTRLLLKKLEIVNFLRELTGLYSPVAKEYQIQFEFVADEAEIYWCFDPEKLKKILFNLINNAFKYTHDGGWVRLCVKLINSTNGSNKLLRISVEDNGIGIEHDDLPHIFDRFFNPGKDVLQHDSHSSSGIGLALTKQLVELHQGRIYADSKPGEGSKFYFDLIKFDCDDDESTEINVSNENDQYENWEDILDLERSNIQEELVIPDKFKAEDVPVVLVVDDNKEICVTLYDLLKTNYRVHIGRNGEQALQIADKEPVDIVLSDVMMPGIGGIGLCSKLKNNIKTSHIPVVLLTAKTGIDNELEGLRMGADAYITKPFNFEKVLLTIKNILSNRKKAQVLIEDNQKSDELVLNPLDKKLIDRVFSVIDERISDSSLSVDLLGQEVGLSRMHLFRKLKALTGYAPSELIKKVRLEKSKELLDLGELSISDIAYDTGFSSSGNFSTSFKKFYGLTPAQYRSKK